MRAAGITAPATNCNWSTAWASILLRSHRSIQPRKLSTITKSKWRFLTAAFMNSCRASDHSSIRGIPTFVRMGIGQALPAAMFKTFLISRTTSSTTLLTALTSDSRFSTTQMVTGGIIPGHSPFLTAPGLRISAAVSPIAMVIMSTSVKSPITVIRPRN